MTAHPETDLAPFRDLCTLTERADGRFDAHIASTWTVGPKVHGGSILAVTAAAARHVLRRQMAAEEPGQLQPLAVSVDFQGAPDPGAVVLAVDVRKTGRQISTADVTLWQSDRALVRSSVTLGALDDNPAVHEQHELTDMPVEPLDDAAHYEPDSPMAATVNMGRGCRLALDIGPAAFLRQEQAEPRARMWARPRPGDEADLDTAVLFAMMLSDICPPVVFNIGRLGWAPTVQLTTYLQRRPAPGWLRVEASARSVGTRFFDEDHLVVDSTGAVVAQSRQLAMVPRG
ncbi:MAG TPA: thioesterase family protein [Aldersonia sp.]